MVIDASVALKWVLSENGSIAAAALRAEGLIAPSLWLAEAGNALWRGVRIGQLSSDQAMRFLAELSNAPVAAQPIETHVEPALRLAMDLGHPIYDCLYLAVAIQHQTHVVTADRRFAAIGDRPEMAGRVRLLGG
jgi:predicted nucleic acid-binding protein